AVPLIVVSVLFTNLPAPQLTYGEMFESLKRAEIVAGVSPTAPGELAAALPASQPKASVKPFLQAFGAISQSDFLTLFLALTLGAAAPACPEPRNQLVLGSAPLHRLERAFRSAVRDQRPSACRFRQAFDVQGHRAVAGKRSPRLVQ